MKSAWQLNAEGGPGALYRDWAVVATQYVHRPSQGAATFLQSVMILSNEFLRSRVRLQ